MMRLRKFCRWIILAGVVPLAVIGLYLGFWPVPDDPPEPRYVSVALAGITSDHTGKALPVFTVSNVAGFNVDCRIAAQVQKPIVPGRSTSVGWLWRNERSLTLQPGQSTNITAEPPTNRVPWRLTVYVEGPPTATQRALAKVGARLPKRIYWFLYGDHRGTQFFTSPVFNHAEPLAGPLDKSVLDPAAPLK